MTKLLAVALVLAACDEKPLPPPPDEEAPAYEESRARQEDPPPPEEEDDDGRPLPVALPTVEKAAALPHSATFIALTMRGEISVGKLAGGLRAVGGTVVKTEQIAETLAKLFGDNVGPGSGPVLLRAVPGYASVDTIALVDENATAATFVPVLQQAAQRRTAIGVNVRAGRGRLAFLTGASILRGAPVHFEVTTSGISIYGTPTAWADVGSTVQDLLDTHKRASSMSILADVTIAPSTPVERVVKLLALLTANGISEAQLTVDASLAPVRPPGVYVTRDGGVPTVTLGQPNAQGDLDKAIIRRYIKRNIQKIQYCYEKQLLAEPQLAGTVSTQFFIAPTGKVAQATGSGVHPDVARCVSDVIRQIEFPRPKGGGGVQVNYPFTFRPSGG